MNSAMPSTETFCSDPTEGPSTASVAPVDSEPCSVAGSSSHTKRHVRRRRLYRQIRLLYSHFGIDLKRRELRCQLHTGSTKGDTASELTRP